MEGSMKLAIAFLLLASFQGKKDQILFNPPDGAKEEEVVKAAMALQARCASYGLSGMKATSENGKVLLRCPTGITPEMEQTIRFLAMFSGRKYSLHQAHRMSAVEQQQYKQPEKDFENAPSPAGTKWYSSKIGLGGFAGYPAFLLKADPVCQKFASKLKTENTPTPYYEVANSTARGIRVGNESTVTGIYLVLDGRAMPVPGSIDFDYYETTKTPAGTLIGKQTAKVRYSLPNEIAAVDHIIQNPSPFGLIQEK
jgi:hypothetical protein